MSGARLQFSDSQTGSHLGDPKGSWLSSSKFFGASSSPPIEGSPESADRETHNADSARGLSDG
jgi:hypothetical protein